ncbi:MAG: hypothetical protein INR71_09465, partial [Terriglobus roseus]|nr:hypothetical protein [Terriglobus roseus]
GQGDLRRVLLSAREKLLCWVGRVERHGDGAAYSKFFEREAPSVHEEKGVGAIPNALSVAPDEQQAPSFGADAGTKERERPFAWLNGRGVLHGKLLTEGDTSNLSSRILADTKMLDRSKLSAPSAQSGGRPKSSQEPAQSMILTQWHILQLVDGRIIATNVLDDSVAHDQLVLEPGQTALGLTADIMKNTFWLFTSQEIFEVVATEEERDVWKIMLKAQKFDAASQFARTSVQKDVVATASGDYLVKKGKFLEAAAVYGRSTKPFELVALTFIDHNEQDALRKYLTTKLSNLKKTSLMQRTMLASWLVEIYMAKLNSLDDSITTKAELTEGVDVVESKDQLSAVRSEFQSFATRYKTDLDKKTTYEVISSHGREEELLFYATLVNDYNFVLTYWVQRERWEESLKVLQKQADPEVFYKYSTVLMAHMPLEFVEILMRQSVLDPEKLIPAMLNYSKLANVPLAKVCPPWAYCFWKPLR